MSQPDESREKTRSTDAVLMHPGNDPRREAAQEKPPPERGRTLVERNGRMVPVDQDG
ncbi:hypothetical protein [Micromonospora coxensis]|uniref:Uncharacterized protein n=1 Tax=Micromonospora coxensis TaxID=356852 RepID=A0A1C5JQD6_9ACTN|nr:hypothetical protein [Micromonospora coxensis]SCG72551.1 hypothetical protein GA0070614_5020 [Micromonospora coxensis]